MTELLKIIMSPEPVTCSKCGVAFGGNTPIIDGVKYYPKTFVCSRCMSGEDARARKGHTLERLLQAGLEQVELERALEHELRPELAEWVDTFGAHRASCARWLWGDYGSGKTTQAILCVHRFLSRNSEQSAVFVSQADLLARIHWGAPDHVPLSHFVDAPFLVLDDLGKGSEGNNTREREARTDFWRLIKARNASRKMTLFTSNARLSTFMRSDAAHLWNEAICHRVVEMLGAPSAQIEFSGNHRIAAFKGY